MKAYISQKESTNLVLFCIFPELILDRTLSPLVTELLLPYLWNNSVGGGVRRVRGRGECLRLCRAKQFLIHEAFSSQFNVIDICCTVYIQMCKKIFLTIFLFA